jgi:hypothetical protein
MTKRMLLVTAGLSCTLLGAAACAGGGSTAHTALAPVRASAPHEAAGAVGGGTSGGSTGGPSFTGDTVAGPESLDAGAGRADTVKQSISSPPINGLAGRDLVFTADLTLRVKHLDDDASKVEQVATRMHGFVSDEQIDSDPGNTGTGEATITLRVPQSSFDATLRQLALIGKQLSVHRSVDDVTDQTIDTASRLRTQQASIARIRALLNHATDLGQIIQLESELTQREAALESLQHRLHALRQQVALTTVTVTLESHQTQAPTRHHQRHHHGFLGGLYAGWDAFVDAGTAILTAIGAVLPFVGALVVLIALAIGWRRRARTSVTT